MTGLDDKVAEWLAWDRNAATRAEIEALAAGGESERHRLAGVLLERLGFGTAGLRGRMAAGYACMNDLVIVQTAQGLLRHLEREHGELLKSNGIVLGYDGRHNSKRFAELTAAIFLHAGHPVRLFGDLVPTPFVPFSVAKWKCAAGVMVTASHNPKDDNGYKVYGSNGSQIISPADKQIQQLILENVEPWPTSWDTDILNSHPSLHDPLDEVKTDYYAIIVKTILNQHKEDNKKTSLKFAYTAMHGVGYKYIVESMQRANLTVVSVKEQNDPDPDFPTVKFPNPEEGKSSLDLSFKTADANGCNVILANDPDADRLAIAEKDPSTGAWKVFNGNEIGALLGSWQLENFKNLHPDVPLADVYMLASTVSSKILRTMARKEGFNFIETLTGFKWMGNQAHQLINNGKHVVFAYEEAIGFMCGSSVLDKDGVSAAVILATFAVQLYKQGSTLSEKLDEIYCTYGHHVSNNSYYICHDGPTINRIFERLRNFTGQPNTYPENILDGNYEIISVRDLTTGYDNSQGDCRAVLPVSKSSQMITFEFSNGLVATLRTSGTEPKIKYYTELCAAPSQRDRDVIVSTSEEMVMALVEDFLQPEKNDLIARSS